jgi:hypothetical protein
MLAFPASREQPQADSFPVVRGGVGKPAMRFLVAFLLLAGMASGKAVASSFVMPEPMKEGAKSSSIVTLGAPAADSKAASPSFIALGSPAPSPTFVALSSPPPSPTQAVAAIRTDGPVTPSPSIIALGEPAVTLEKVAAIPAEKKTKRLQELPPMVIRGGLIGNAFERAVAPQQVSEPEAATAAAPAADRPRRRTPPKPPAGTILPAPEPAVDAPGPVER